MAADNHIARESSVTLFEYIKQETYLAGMILADEHIASLEKTVKTIGPVGDPNMEHFLEAIISATQFGYSINTLEAAALIKEASKSEKRNKEVTRKFLNRINKKKR